jgi:hypothetical protein
MKSYPFRNIRWQNLMFQRLCKSVLACAIALVATLSAQAVLAGTQHPPAIQPTASSVLLPLVQGWYDGEQVLYIQTEVSDPDEAKAQNVNYVPRLANAIPADANSPSSVDDIYVVSGFTQGNVIPSAPNPAGPENQDTDYSPLWQVSVVTWAQGTTPYLLTSEQAIFTARDQGLVTIAKTNIVVNCPVMFTPSGGLLPTAKLLVRPVKQK